MPLPLRLAPFEHYMLCDDRAAYPMTFFLRLALSGTFDRPRFIEALRLALDRHPFLRAHVSGSGNRRQWTAATNVLPPVVWDADFEAVPAAADRAIDLTKQTGLRIFVREEAGRTELVAQVHHACCDGLGGHRFMEDVLVAYDWLTRRSSNMGAADAGEASGPPFRPLDTARLEVRHRFGLTWSTRLRRAYYELVGLIGACQFFFHRPRELARPDAPAAAESEPPLFSWHCHYFTTDESKRLRQAGERLQTSTNDLLLRDLFLALDDWQSTHGPLARGECIRVAVPLSMRTAGDDEALPASNCVSLIFLDRDHRDCGNRDVLLRGVKHEMNLISRMRLGLTFLHSVRLASLVPGGLKSMTHADRCQATVVLTNTADPYRRTPLGRRQHSLVVGNLLLDEVGGAPPIRPWTSAVFAISSYARRFSVTVHYDPRHLSSARAEELLGLFVGRIRAATDSQADADPRPALAPAGDPGNVSLEIPIGRV